MSLEKKYHYFFDVNKGRILFFPYGNKLFSFETNFSDVRFLNMLAITNAAMVAIGLLLIVAEINVVVGCLIVALFNVALGVFLARRYNFHGPIKTHSFSLERKNRFSKSILDFLAFLSVSCACISAYEFYSSLILEEMLNAIIWFFASIYFFYDAIVRVMSRTR